MFHEFTHPIALGLMVITLGLGIGVGYLIHTVRGDESASRSGSTQEEIVDRRFQDGGLFGFVTSFESSGETVYLGLDEALWLTGDAAVEAALAAGVCVPEYPEDCAPTDYFIENTSDEVSWYVISPDATITVQSVDRAENSSLSRNRLSLSEFRQRFEEPRSALLFRRIPFRITLEDGIVTVVEEQYVP